MVGKSIQKTITMFSEHFDKEAEAVEKARKEGKKFKTSEFFRWCLENKVEEYIEQSEKVIR